LCSPILTTRPTIYTLFPYTTLFRSGAEPMESFEPKKLALIRIWQILKEYSDYDHPLTQDDIARHLENNYGIVIERKAISRNISLDRKSTRLNSSHVSISYAVFCLKQ